MFSFKSLSLLSLCLILTLPWLSPTTGQAQDDTIRVRVAVIPVLDTLPLFIAQDAGYFEAEGLDVELIPVTSGIERDQLIQAGEADAMLTDIQGVGFFNEVRTRVQIVYTSRVALEAGPLFRILAAPDSGIDTPQKLAAVPIGVSEATVIEYLTWRLLENAGVEDIETQAIPAIPTRFQLLMAGELKAATLPDPLAQAAIEAGAIPILDDSIFAEEEFSQSVLVFTQDFINDEPEAVAAFLRAWDAAVVDLNADPEAFRQLFLEKTVVPEIVRDTYVIPPFPRGLITSEAVWDDTMDWMLEHEILEDKPAYADSVNPAFMPDIPELPADNPEATEEAEAS
jgi:NitT/TauT family transport system substrate-binding protein